MWTPTLCSKKLRQQRRWSRNCRRYRVRCLSGMRSVPKASSGRAPAGPAELTPEQVATAERKANEQKLRSQLGAADSSQKSLL